MTPTQEFLERNPGVFAEMIADFQQRKQMVETAKSKDPVDANVVDNPNLRAHIPYPKLMYNHARRITLRVENAVEHEKALAEGWREQPWHGPADPGVPIGPATAGSEMDEERMDSLETRMLSLEQAIGDMTGTLAEIVKRLPKERQKHQPQEA